MSIRSLTRAPLGVQVSFLGLGLVLVAVAFPALFSSFDPNATVLLDARHPPLPWGGTPEHLLGTDQIGRDLFSRCVHGLQVSVGITLVGLLIGSFLGVSLGLVSGYFGSWPDRIIMAVVDFQMAIPFTLIVVLALVLFGTGIPVLISVIGLAKWETYARMTRSVVLSARETTYVTAARTMNVPTLAILVRHILPNVLPVVIVLLTLNFPGILMLESSLSFLGIGVQPPTATLGRMVGEGKNYLMTLWWVALLPALVILVVSLMVQRVGDWLRDVLDVRTGA